MHKKEEKNSGQHTDPRKMEYYELCRAIRARLPQDLYIRTMTTMRTRVV